MKFNFPISSATAVLAWGLVQWKNAYVNAGLHAEMLDCIKWSLDFLLKCWKPDQQVLYGQVQTIFDLDLLNDNELFKSSLVSRHSYVVIVKIANLFCMLLFSFVLRSSKTL